MRPKLTSAVKKDLMIDSKRGVWRNSILGCALASLLCAGAGCSTFQAGFQGGSEPLVFGGTRLNVEIVGGGAPGPNVENQMIYGLIDLPLSLVADSVVLPVQLLRIYSRQRAVSRDPEFDRGAFTARPVPEVPAESLSDRNPESIQLAVSETESQ